VLRTETRAGLALLTAGLLFLAGACFASYHSGCVFDSKQGYGDYARGQLYANIALVLLVGEIGCVGLAALLCTHPRPLQALLLAVAAVLVAAPVSIYLVFDAGFSGIIACKPG
jgi:hypothetical protein